MTWTSSLSDADRPRIYLNIARGRTGQPLRPVPAGRFLIGSGPHCDLRLGGPEIPPLHSIITVENNDIWLEQVAHAPPLLVNGVERPGGPLQAGDEISIGPFELEACPVQISAGETPIELPEEAVVTAGESSPVLELPHSADFTANGPDLSSMPAAELVARIEAEERQVTRFDEGRKAGAGAFLDAVLQQARQQTQLNGPVRLPVPIPVISEFEDKEEIPFASPSGASPFRPSSGTVDDSLIVRLELLIDRVESLTDGLHNRLERLADRETRNVQAANSAQNAQERLIERLEQMIERLQGSGGDARQVRVVA